MVELNTMHIDMDAFFASVEQEDNPKLKGKPVIIGGVYLSDRGVVSTASYEARKFGIHSAMAIIKAKQLCPQGIYLQGRHERYNEISQQIFAIFRSYTPIVEKLSIDEAFLDLTGCHKLFGNSREIGKLIKKEIKTKTGLVASVGIAPNKFLAKLASTLDKPNGFVVIRKDEIEEIIDPLPINKMWGVGEKTEKKLKDIGIKTIGMIKNLSLNDLTNLFGKFGHKLYYLSRGIDQRDVTVNNETKSISQEKTFSSNLTENKKIYSVLMKMVEQVIRRLRKKKLRGSTIFIKVRYDDFSTITRRKTLKRTVNRTEDVYSTAKKLLYNNKLLRKPIRLLGVGVSNLTENTSQQMSLFRKDDNVERLNATIEGIKDRFGENSLKRGIELIKPDNTE
jgi:DNA polymerase-4